MTYAITRNFGDILTFGAIEAMRAFRTVALTGYVVVASGRTEQRIRSSPGAVTTDGARTTDVYNLDCMVLVLVIVVVVLKEVIVVIVVEIVEAV